MNSHYHSPHDSPLFQNRYPSDDLRRLMSSAHAALEQPPPPTLRDILSAYKSKGDGDRDMLLAMLSAKTAEDQRQASIANLQRTLLEIYKQPVAPSESVYPSRPAPNSVLNYHYPTPGFAQSPRSSEQSSRRVHHRHRLTSRSRSPPPSSRPYPHMPPSRDVQLSHHPEHPRKRHRSSHSPHVSHSAIYESLHPSEQFPPSPYSSSDRSDSAEYSPRSRASMTIGSLLSSGPNREMKEDIPERD